MEEGGAPHHRLLASPPDAEALTRRILVPGLQARFVASPQVVGLALQGGRGAAGNTLSHSPWGPAQLCLTTGQGRLF